MDKSVIFGAVTVAGGRFAPGHLGELTRQVPFKMVGAVGEETCRLQRRVRDLPARVVVYPLLAGCLFAELGYSQVWGRLAAGLNGLTNGISAADSTQIWDWIPPMGIARALPLALPAMPGLAMPSPPDLPKGLRLRNGGGRAA